MDRFGSVVLIRSYAEFTVELNYVIRERDINEWKQIIMDLRIINSSFAVLRGKSRRFHWTWKKRLFEIKM